MGLAECLMYCSLQKLGTFQAYLPCTVFKLPAFLPLFCKQLFQVQLPIEQHANDSVNNYKPYQFSKQPHTKELDITCLTVMQDRKWGFWNNRHVGTVGEGAGWGGLLGFE